MSFLTDLFRGNTGNLGNDLFGSPTAIAETLGIGALPFLPALAGLAVPAVGEAAAGFGAGEGASGLGGLLSSLGLTADQVDPTLLGAGAAAQPAGGLATGIGGTAGSADASTALGFGGGAPIQGFTGLPAGEAGNIGYFPSFGSSTELAAGGTDPAFGAYGGSGYGGGPYADITQLVQPTSSALGAPGADISAALQANSLTGGGVTIPGVDAAGALATPGATAAPALATPGATAAPAADLGGAPLASPEFSTPTPANPLAGGSYGVPSSTPAPASFLDKWGGTIAGIGGLGALGLGGQIVGPKIASALGLNTPPGSAQLNQVATEAEQLKQQQQQFGNTLEQGLLTGVLPPGVQASIDQATQAAIATVRSRFASMGMGNSEGEAQAIAAIKQQAQVNGFEIAQQMAQQGQTAITSAQNALGLSESVYASLMNATIAQDAQLSNAISGFASAVGGGLAVGTGQQLAKNALSK